MDFFLNALLSRRPLLMDGAMGSQLLRKGIALQTCFESLNLTDPETIDHIHRGYVRAGAEVLLTNTFLAYPDRLARCGLLNRSSEIVSSGIQIARGAFEKEGRAGFVLGDLGPHQTSPEELKMVLSAFQPADGLLLETASDFALLDMVQPILPRLGFSPDFPLLFSATFLHTGDGIRTSAGLSAQAVARGARERNVSALGVNCGKEIGLDEIFGILEEYRKETEVPLFARPNAGTPRRENGGWVYPVGPERMAQGMKGILKAGVALIGGCCGTTPDHIACMKGQIEKTSPKR